MPARTVELRFFLSSVLLSPLEFVPFVRVHLCYHMPQLELLRCFKFLVSFGGLVGHGSRYFQDHTQLPLVWDRLPIIVAYFDLNSDGWFR